MAASLAERLAAVAPWLLEGLGDAEAEALAEDWSFWARPEQLAPPGDWFIWAIITGRGWGKTRTGAEWIHQRVRQGFGRIHLVGRTAADYRDVMVEGESGILATAKRDLRVEWVSTRRKLIWENGAVALCFSAEEPDQLRGPQCDTAWADEPSTWQMLVDDSGATAWDNLLLGLRLGRDPRMVATMTPKPMPLVRDLVRRVGIDVHLTSGSLLENRSNLAPGFIREILSRYEGTALGEQEIHGVILDGIEGTLWTTELIERDRLAAPLPREAYDQVVVGVDPATGPGETGIVAVGRTADRTPDENGRLVRHLHVLEDATTTGSPQRWAARVAEVAARWRTRTVVAEANQGGAMVRAVVHNVAPDLWVRLVRAVESKRARAEPVAQLSEQGRLHVVGRMADLEMQMVAWTPGEDSPDRLDALVWAATALMPGVVSVGGQLHSGATMRVAAGRWS